MKSSRKIIILLPPLLIGFTILLFIFTYQHQVNLNTGAYDTNSEVASSSDSVVITEPLPEPIPFPEPDTTTDNQAVFCTADVKQCPDGSFVGRVAPDCSFAACPTTEVETCSPESRLAEFCAEIFAPVCGALQVECVTEPCEPTPVTFSNECFACSNERVVSYAAGACEAAS